MISQILAFSHIDSIFNMLCFKRTLSSGFLPISHASGLTLALPMAILESGPEGLAFRSPFSFTLYLDTLYHS